MRRVEYVLKKNNNDNKNTPYKRRGGGFGATAERFSPRVTRSTDLQRIQSTGRSVKLLVTGVQATEAAEADYTYV